MITTREIEGTALALLEAEWAVQLLINDQPKVLVLENTDGERKVILYSVVSQRFLAAFVEWPQFETPDVEGEDAVVAWVEAYNAAHAS